MAEHIESRRPIASIALFLVLIGLGARFIRVALGDTPAAEAAKAGGPRALLRVEWLAGCGPTTGVGLFAVADAPCQPSRVVPLNWLQGQLAGLDLLAAGEYLEMSPHPAQPACGVTVLGSDGAPVGWLCADVNGLYRTVTGTDPGARWQLWSDGAWQQVR